MKKTLMVIGLLLIFPLILTACGEEVTEEILEEVFEDVYGSNDFDAYNDIACEASEVDGGDVDMLDTDVSSVQCEIGDNDRFECSVFYLDSVIEVTGAIDGVEICDVNMPAQRDFQE